MAAKKTNKSNKLSKENAKTESLSFHTEESDGEFLTTNHGVKVNDDQNSLKAGSRGANFIGRFYSS